jgi:hypothetical protein
MKTHFRSEDDGWTAERCKTTAPEALEAIRRCLEEEDATDPPAAGR